MISPQDNIELHPRAALAQALAQTITRIHARGWAEGTGGNFSAVLAREPLRLLMAPSGVDKGRVAAEDLIEVDGAGGVRRGAGKPSAETLLHLAIVKATGAGAVLHTHSVTATVLSLGLEPQGAVRMVGLEMLKGLAGITSHEASVTIPIFANTQDMAACATMVGQFLTASSKPQHGVLLAGHGLYTWGQDLAEAERHVQILEFLFEVTYRQHLLGAALCSPGQDLPPTLNR